MLLAQVGCWVPASRARLTPVDAIVAVTPSTPSITSGLSTFMVELNKVSEEERGGEWVCLGESGEDLYVYITLNRFLVCFFYVNFLILYPIQYIFSFYVSVNLYILIL